MEEGGIRKGSREKGADTRKGKGIWIWVGRGWRRGRGSRKGIKKGRRTREVATTRRQGRV